MKQMHLKGMEPHNQKQILIKRLDHIEEQIRSIKWLIENETYCDDVITHISNTKGDLNTIQQILFDLHTRSFIIERIKEGDNEFIDILLATIRTLVCAFGAGPVRRWCNFG